MARPNRCKCGADLRTYPELELLRRMKDLYRPKVGAVDRFEDLNIHGVRKIERLGIKFGYQVFIERGRGAGGASDCNSERHYRAIVYQMLDKHVSSVPKDLVVGNV